MLYTKPNSLENVAIIKQINKPIMVGINIDAIVHFKLCVSFLIVNTVVPHGQCINEKIITQTAVSHVHPFATRSSLS